ncbi:MAG: class I SAM-dependent methyltransferase [Deltaproteobacteria bacterium]|nr:class I SAM-dependent methyltransferase [Deltaproteobacteria bacterium]
MDLTNSSLDMREETFWEKMARTKWGRYISEVEQRAILKANGLAKGAKAHTAIDVGCEGGRWSKLLVDLGWDVICIDIFPNELAKCQKRLPTTKCILIDKHSKTLPCEREKLELVLCIEVPAIASEWFCAEAFRVLYPGGLVVGVFLNKLSIRGYFYHLVSSLWGRNDYYKHAYPSWRKKFCTQGFKMIAEEGICWFPFSRGSNSALVPMITKIEQYLGMRRMPIVSPWIVFVAQKVSLG